MHATRAAVCLLKVCLYERVAFGAERIICFVSEAQLLWDTHLIWVRVRDRFLLVMWPYAWDLQDMIWGKLSTQSEPFPCCDWHSPTEKSWLPVLTDLPGISLWKHHRCHFLASDHLPHWAAIAAAVPLSNAFTAPQWTALKTFNARMILYLVQWPC